MIMRSFNDLEICLQGLWSDGPTDIQDDSNVLSLFAGYN